MQYKDIRESLEQILNENYRDTIKAIIGIEKGIEDEDILDEVFNKYIETDDLFLINDDFDSIINDIKSKEKNLSKKNKEQEKGKAR